MPRIEDYALIGDLQTAALVSREGSIDWCCFPRFDSGACFAALLGEPHHGRWLLAPATRVRRSYRRYRTDTLILESVFETDEGTVRGSPRDVDVRLGCAGNRQPQRLSRALGARKRRSAGPEDDRGHGYPERQANSTAHRVSAKREL